MKRGQRPSAEQVVLTLRRIEVQTAQGKSIAVACKEADVSEQSDSRADECLKQEIFYSLKEAQVVIDLWQNTCNRTRPHSSLGYRPPAPVSLPDLAFRLPMAATTQWPLIRPVQDTGQVRSGLGRNLYQKQSKYVIRAEMMKSVPGLVQYQYNCRKGFSYA
ncbi:hypothetical protein AEGHOMDF_1810 [Methylobacterium soli]|nr:hypothetical protein AEGHOMDF_1810 [Methylobacterium soli]